MQRGNFYHEGYEDSDEPRDSSGMREIFHAEFEEAQFQRAVDAHREQVAVICINSAYVETPLDGQKGYIVCVEHCHLGDEAEFVAGLQVRREFRVIGLVRGISIDHVHKLQDVLERLEPIIPVPDVTDLQDQHPDAADGELHHAALMEHVADLLLPAAMQIAAIGIPVRDEDDDGLEPRKAA